MSQKKKPNNDVQNLLRTRSRWLIRHGISLLFGLVLLLFGGSYFVHLPNITTAGAVLLTNPNNSTVWRLRLPQPLHSFLSSGQSLRLQFTEPYTTNWLVSVVETVTPDTAVTDYCEVEIQGDGHPPVAFENNNEVPCYVEISTGSYRLSDKLFGPFGKNNFGTSLRSTGKQS